MAKIPRMTLTIAPCAIKVITKLKSDKDKKRAIGETSSASVATTPTYKKVSWAKTGNREDLQAFFQESINNAVQAAVAATQKMFQDEQSSTAQEFNNLTLSDSEKSERSVASVAESDDDE